MICIYYNTKEYWWFVFIIIPRIIDDLHWKNTRDFWWFKNYIILKELDDLYLEYWGCVMIWIYYDTTESWWFVFVILYKDFWWFVFTTILKGIDDLYAREDNQCNMFLYQEETTHLASHQNLSGATPLNINMIRTLWKPTITKKWKDKSTFQTSKKSGSMWKFVS